MTFSLVGRCSKTGQLGMVISSSSPAVAARCAHVRANVGVVASQNVTDPELGPLLLDLIAKGNDAAQALSKLVQNRTYIEYRQLLAVDHSGGVAIHSGKKVLGIWGETKGNNCAAGGNLLANPSIPAAMTAAFEASEGLLGDRLMLVLQAGLAAGGEAGPVHSAGLKIADKLSWPVVDLRVDWADQPIEQLASLWAIYKPQMGAYVQRALDPTKAPSYGVPGDK
jgi:uncharacterized Ntn-hydrolase superfamily protein